MDTEFSIAESTGWHKHAMLYKSINISWKEHFTNKNLYGKLPLISFKLKSRLMKIDRHCIRYHELSAHRLILWKPW